ncbi:uncharacterized protein AC631_01399 [Debaryomyces fabryi]|uniref:3-oxoacyl-[acyl-carrier-protein] reductase n=1 Tax=Debaryomyces fabryi TaxID=58627 RepID=A0A0V1Q2W9_9ASCO|nr:uncharacterized protein AC631_01399 [Debaryomyces fabryi]KSA02802.1 hypothetical protein AC631_01399 [Debaryomyces fabryi]CUM46094.1 unnamed protein product [Debaryomyces fabryi]
MSFIGKKALVTGASKGLGYALSQRLAQLGCSVTLLARNEKLLKRNIDSLPVVASDQSHRYISCDLQELSDKEKSDSNLKIHNELMNSLTDVSILVNCAGITTHRLLPRISSDEILSTVGLNLTAPIILSKLSCRPMMKVASKLKASLNPESFKKPIILNISSILSMTDNTLPGTAVYAALKAGLLGFTKSLAAEFRGKIRVNALLPGLIVGTQMGANAMIDDGELKLKEVSLDDVVGKAIEIISNDSINGQNVLIDGKDGK